MEFFGSLSQFKQQFYDYFDWTIHFSIFAGKERKTWIPTCMWLGHQILFSENYLFLIPIKSNYNIISWSVVAERSKRQSIDREPSYWRFRMSSKSRRGSSVLWQGALSSFAKSFGGDFKPSVPCIGESHPMHIKEPTSLLAKSREKSRWSGQPVKHTETGVWCRPLVVHPRRLHTTVCNLQTTSTRHLNMPYERRRDIWNQST